MAQQRSVIVSVNTQEGGVWGQSTDRVGTKPARLKSNGTTRLRDRIGVPAERRTSFL